MLTSEQKLELLKYVFDAIKQTQDDSKMFNGFDVIECILNHPHHSKAHKDYYDRHILPIKNYIASINN